MEIFFLNFCKFTISETLHYILITKNPEQLSKYSKAILNLQGLVKNLLHDNNDTGVCNIFKLYLILVLGLYLRALTKSNYSQLLL